MKKNLLLSLAGAAAIGLGAYAAIPESARVSILDIASGPSAPTQEMSSSSSAEEAPLNINLGQKGAYPKTIDELCKGYVMTYVSARTNFIYRMGQYSPITRMGNTDTVLIANLYQDGALLKAVPNFADSTLIIPKQYLFNRTNGGKDQQVWFVPRVTTNGTSWTTKWDVESVTMKINADGTITMPTDGWSLSCMELDGTTTSSYWMMANNGTTLVPTNGTMTYTKAAVGETPASTKTIGIYGEQNGNVLTVLNFSDYGTYYSFFVNSDGSIWNGKSKVCNYTYNNVPYDLFLCGDVRIEDGYRYWNWTISSKSSTKDSFTLGPWCVQGYDSQNTLRWDGLFNDATLKFDFDINYNAGTLKGAGTSSNPYQIGSVADLQAFMNMAANSECGYVYFKQTADIDLGGVDVTNAIPAFGGNYDGNGHTLKGIKIETNAGTAAAYYYQGMINTLTSTGNIKNLTIDGNATLKSYYAGPLCGQVYGTLDNVTSKVTVNNTQYYAGGIIGVADAGSKISNCVYDGKFTIENQYVGGITGASRRATLTNCGFTGEFIPTATAKNYVGGIIGLANPSDVISCYNKGTMPNDSLGAFRGGIIAYANVAAAATSFYGTYNIKNCVNYANLYGKNLGGIIANQSVSVANTATNYIYRSYTNVDSCVNYGNIHVTATTASGGILGQHSHSTKVTNCFNYGKISGYKSMNVGGIVGGNNNAATDSTRSLIADCVNYGDFTLSLDNQTTNYYNGGIAGNLGANTTIKNCSNFGNIKSWYEHGGIVGTISVAGDSIVGCVNYGNIEGVYQIGGIVGYLTNVTAVVDGCANFGNVKSTSTLGGILSGTTSGYSGQGEGGIAGYARGNFINCLNAGTVSGTTHVGGIVGRTYPGTTATAYGTRVENNLNTGKIIGTYLKGDQMVLDLDTVGPIIGVKTITKTTYYNPEFNIAKNNYYIPASLSEYENVPSQLPLHLEGDAKEISESALVNSGILGSAWETYDKYCWPSPIACSWSDMTKVWAAQVVAKGNDVLPTITTNFFVGRPSGLKWTSSVSGLTIHGWEANWSSAAYTGKLTLTATCGDFSKQVELNVSKNSGIDNLDADGRTVVSEMWITTEGVKVARPAFKNGKVYLVVRKYDDGTAETIKVFN